ncbi:FAD-dependent oxidoreductase [Streptomyces sp. NPDC051546]|uniref:FAD-dependent oxidoreductase n=1 Tax=Streptomyces sp. NPDC051546 TaxID=3365655 RepID=UPI0037AADCCC
MRAVVLGGSIAGLLAARVLHEHADEVVILEPDGTCALPSSGAPQRTQLHALLAGGHEQLERIFPGLTDQMVAGGARLGTGGQVQFYVDGQLKASTRDACMIGATRAFIEQHVRQRVLALDNVRLLTGQARGLRIRAERVYAVPYRDADSGQASELPADFVVDAMGRSSRLGHWLDQQGWPVPRTERMRIALGYATASFHRGSELPDTVIAHATPGPASNYLPTVCEPGALTAVENQRWNAVIAGYDNYRPSQDPDAFRARMLRCVEPLQQVARHCEMDGEPASFYVQDSQRRHFTRLPRLPGGLVVMGDALASVNPIYGQGMSMAALQAVALDRHLRSATPAHQPAYRYFRRAGSVVNAAWQLSTTADLAQPHVTGPYPFGYPLLRWAADQVTRASIVDPGINSTYMDVVHMRRHPRALTSPRVLLRTTRTLLTK